MILVIAVIFQTHPRLYLLHAIQPPSRTPAYSGHARQPTSGLSLIIARNILSASTRVIASSPILPSLYSQSCTTAAAFHGPNRGNTPRNNRGTLARSDTNLLSTHISRSSTDTKNGRAIRTHRPSPVSSYFSVECICIFISLRRLEMPYLIRPAITVHLCIAHAPYVLAVFIRFLRR